MTVLKIGITGAAGRMGKMLIAEAVRNNHVDLIGATTRENDPNRGMDAGEVAGVGRQNIRLRHNPVDMFEDADVVIDFTTPAASLEHCMLAHEYKTSLVIGTTGFNPAQLRMLRQHGESVPIVASPNMSLGVTILNHLAQQVASLLDDSYDIDIFEAHHRDKVDAPSGTALAMGRAAARGRGVSFDEVAAYERSGKRSKGDIGFAVSRAGDVIGDHTITFAGSGERLEISHKASNRRIYASGAIKAALWLAQQEAGLYTMRDVLGLPAWG